MKEMMINLRDAFKFITTDPVNLLLALVPTILSLLLYTFGIWLIVDNSSLISEYLQSYFKSSNQVIWITRILTGLFVVFFFFFMSWTFLLIVELVSFPFNALLSTRIEQKILGKKSDNSKVSFLKSLKNEFKKMIFISLMTILAFFMNFIPILYPLSFFLVALLLSIQFLDYTWSRHEQSFGECFKEMMSNLWIYFLSGALFLGLVSVPLLNLFVPALATSYFTVSWVRRSRD